MHSSGRHSQPPSRTLSRKLPHLQDESTWFELQAQRFYELLQSETDEVALRAPLAHCACII